MFFSINILKAIECSLRGCCRNDSHNNFCDGCYCMYFGPYYGHGHRGRNDTCFTSCLCCCPSSGSNINPINFGGSEKLCCSSCELKATCQPILKCLYDICKSFKTCGVSCFKTGYKLGAESCEWSCECCEVLKCLVKCCEVLKCLVKILECIV